MHFLFLEFGKVLVKNFNFFKLFMKQVTDLAQMGQFQKL